VWRYSFSFIARKEKLGRKGGGVTDGEGVGGKFPTPRKNGDEFGKYSVKNDRSEPKQSSS